MTTFQFSFLIGFLCSGFAIQTLLIKNLQRDIRFDLENQSESFNRFRSMWIHYLQNKPTDEKE